MYGLITLGTGITKDTWLGDDFVMTKGDFLKRIPRIFSCFSFLLPVYVYLDTHILIRQIAGFGYFSLCFAVK